MLTCHSQLVPRWKIHGSIHPLPHTSSWRSASLVKHRDKFTFYLVCIIRNGNIISEKLIGKDFEDLRLARMNGMKKIMINMSRISSHWADIWALLLSNKNLECWPLDCDDRHSCVKRSGLLLQQSTRAKIKHEWKKVSGLHCVPHEGFPRFQSRTEALDRLTVLPKRHRSFSTPSDQTQWPPVACSKLK
jgi:hypothetical protein